MHCSTDLTAARREADADGDGYWDDAERGPDADGGGLFGPDGPVDGALTVAVGLVAGLVVGVVVGAVLLLLSGSDVAALAGLLAWAGTTAHLVRQRTALTAVARAAYGVAGALLLVPLVAFSPADGGADFGTRVVVFATVLGGVAVPAALVAGLGIAVSRLAGGSAADE